MINSVFPKYKVRQLRDTIKVIIDNDTVILNEISLELLKVETHQKFIQNKEIDIKIHFRQKEMTISGKVEDYEYQRESKNNLYNLKLNFKDKENLKLWLAIIKGLHKARFKC